MSRAKASDRDRQRYQSRFTYRSRWDCKRARTSSHYPNTRKSYLLVGGKGCYRAEVVSWCTCLPFGSLPTVAWHLPHLNSFQLDMQMKVVWFRPKVMTSYKSVAPQAPSFSPPINYTTSSSHATFLLGLVGFLVRCSTRRYMHTVHHHRYQLGIDQQLQHTSLLNKQSIHN